MISKQQYMKSLHKEMDIISHLAAKITPEMLEYRPTEKQRSTLELMNYLGHIVNSAVTMVIAGRTDNYKEVFASAPSVTLENFVSVMEAQDKLVMAKLEPLTETELSENVEVFYHNDSRAAHLLAVLNWVVAYKMQLFLYIKANGMHDIGTSNLWRGMDMPPKA